MDRSTAPYLSVVAFPSSRVTSQGGEAHLLVVIGFGRRTRVAGFEAMSPLTTASSSAPRRAA